MNMNTNLKTCNCFRLKVMYVLLAFIFLPVLLCAQINAEQAYSYYYSKDYATCIHNIHELTSDRNIFRVPQIDNILYCGVLCCEEYNCYAETDWYDTLGCVITLIIDGIELTYIQGPRIILG